MCNQQCESNVEKKKPKRETLDFRDKPYMSLWWLFDNPNSIIKINKEQFDNFCKTDPIYIKYYFEEMKKHNVDIHIELEDMIGFKLSDGKIFEPKKGRKS